MKLTVVTFFALFMTASAQTAGQVHLDAIKANHDHRMVRLAEMIEERRQLVSDHESGRRLLESEEFDKASRQIVAFERKLEMMKKKTEDDHLAAYEEHKKSMRMRPVLRTPEELREM